MHSALYAKAKSLIETKSISENTLLAPEYYMEEVSKFCSPSPAMISEDYGRFKTFLYSHIKTATSKLREQYNIRLRRGRCAQNASSVKMPSPDDWKYYMQLLDSKNKRIAELERQVSALKMAKDTRNNFCKNRM